MSHYNNYEHGTWNNYFQFGALPGMFGSARMADKMIGTVLMEHGHQSNMNNYLTLVLI